MVGSQAVRLRFLIKPQAAACITGRVHNARPQLYYEIDDDESKHELSLDQYGHQDAVNAWVLLEEEAPAA